MSTLLGPFREVAILVYDSAGRVRAQTVGGGAPVCFTYDSRGRIKTTTWPDFGEEEGRTVTYEYALDDNPNDTIPGDPLLSRVSDNLVAGNTGGEITTYRDLLGRVITTEDIWGNQTNLTYDEASGRALSSTGEGGTLASTFDNTGRLDTVALDGEVLADVTYDTISRVTSVDYPNGTNQAGNGTRLHNIAYSTTNGQPIGIEWRDAANALLTSHGRSLDVAGRVVDEMIDTVDPYTTTSQTNPSGHNYLYDTVGRLTEAHVPGHDLTYAFAQSGNTCGLSADAGKNTNRTSMTDNGVPTTYCYDHADRLTQTSADGINSNIDYDINGNTVVLGDTEITYDAGNQHMSTTTGTNEVRYTRDAAGAVVAREATGEDVLRYSSGPAGVALTMSDQDEILERTVGLPGGVTVTIDAQEEERWSYPNLSGSVAAIADGDGVKVGRTYTYDPYGNASTTNTGGTVIAGLPDNREGNLDAGWLGGANTEHAAGTPILIEMGARLYSPLLGRFLEVDPVANGSANPYDYANGDPINYGDPDGKEPWPWQYGADDYQQNLAACGYGGSTNCTQMVDPANPDAWSTDTTYYHQQVRLYLRLVEEANWRELARRIVLLEWATRLRESAARVPMTFRASDRIRLDELHGRMWEIAEELDLIEERGIVGLTETCFDSVLFSGGVGGGLGLLLKAPFKFSALGVATDCLTGAE